MQKFKSATISPVNMPPFVPIDAIIDLLDSETISTALVEASCESVESEKCAYIAENLLRVFATLLFIGNPQAILEFEFRGFTDDVFPLTCADKLPEGNEKEALRWYSTIHPFTGDPNDDLHPVSRCFENPSLWTLNKFEHFYASQWLFSAPVFGTDKFDTSWLHKVLCLSIRWPRTRRAESSVAEFTWPASTQPIYLPRQQ